MCSPPFPSSLTPTLSLSHDPDMRVSGCYGLFIPGPDPGHVTMATMDHFTTQAVELAHSRGLDETRGVTIQVVMVLMFPAAGSKNGGTIFNTLTLHFILFKRHLFRLFILSCASGCVVLQLSNRRQEDQSSHRDPALLAPRPGRLPPLPGPNAPHLLLQKKSASVKYSLSSCLICSQNPAHADFLISCCVLPPSSLLYCFGAPPAGAEGGTADGCHGSVGVVP